MNNANLISLAFLERQPKAAAELLREFSPAPAADFLQTVPLSVLTPVIHEMPSWPAARILSLLPESLIAKVLRGLPASEAETLLRLIAIDLRDAVLTHMPAALAKSFQAKLTYPVSTIGAWMETSVPFFTMDNSVADCLELVKRQKSRLGGVLVVVDYSRHLVGLVEVEKLLTSDAQQPLSELVSADVEALPSRATLWEVQHHDGWIKFPTLPVVDHENILLGVLTHSALKAGTAKSHGNLVQGNKFSLVVNMGRAFFIAFTGLLGVVSGISEHPGRRDNDGKNTL